jgi:hypothetical protein
MGIVFAGVFFTTGFLCCLCEPISGEGRCWGDRANRRGTRDRVRNESTQSRENVKTERIRERLLDAEPKQEFEAADQHPTAAPSVLTLYK